MSRIGYGRNEIIPHKGEKEKTDSVGRCAACPVPLVPECFEIKPPRQEARRVNALNLIVVADRAPKLILAFMLPSKLSG